MASQHDPTSAIHDDVAAAVMMADPGDVESVQALHTLLSGLAATMSIGGDREDVVACAASLEKAIASGTNVDDCIEAAGQLVTKLQHAARAAAIRSLKASVMPRLAAPKADVVIRDSGAPTPDAAPTRAAAGLVPAAAERDAETVELFADFLQEAEEGLDTVDTILLAVHRGEADSERVNALFRVFHTIKGVAGCLELEEVTKLAHTTETLLNRAREGKLTLEGVYLELVFDSTAHMRSLLKRVRAAVESGSNVAPDAAVGPLVVRIEEALANGAQSSKAAPPKLTTVAPAPVRAPSFAAPPAPASISPDAGLSRRPLPLSLVPRQSMPLPAKASLRPPRQSIRARAAGDGSADGATEKIRPTLKVDVERIDNVVEMIGEFIIIESMVVNAPEIAATTSLRVRNYLSQLTKISRDLQSVAMRMRMVPVRGAFAKMARMVHDLSRKTRKDVVLVQSGETAEMDRSMVERIEDPLMHMIRNAVDHGIESAADRVAAGKPALGTIRLSAYHEGGSIVIEIADDGKGLQKEQILAKAIARGLLRESDKPTDQEIFQLIFAPGVSTAAQLTEISGRGVGMDVVKRGIEGVRGRILVSSTPGVGTTFKLVLPLTLAIIDGMLVGCGEERYIIPSLSIIESLQPTAQMVRSLADAGEIINVRGEILPLVRLHRVFAIPSVELPPEQARVVVVEALGRKLGLLVDDVITQQHVVIKPLGAGLGDTDFLSGAAILSDGRVGLILNVDRLAGLVSSTRNARWLRQAVGEAS